MIVGEIKRFIRDGNSLRVSRSIRDTAYLVLKTREKIEERDGALRLVPDTVDPASMTALANAFPQTQIRMVLGGEPALVCRPGTKKKIRMTDFATDLLTKYLQIRHD